MKHMAIIAVVALWPGVAMAAAGHQVPDEPSMSLPVELVQRGRTCRDVSSCREAVELWCGGYSRADADKDGIPCENVCTDKDTVDQIRAEIGC